jgi:hypothetical protein
MQNSESENGAIHPVHDRYKSAIILNNIAVTLLSRGFYSEAMQTIHDSLQLMNVVTAAKRNGMKHGPTHMMFDNRKVDLFLESARRRLVTLPLKELDRIRPVSSLQPADCTYQEIQAQPSQDLYAPIRIDVVDYEYPEMYNADIHGTILLYNYGVARHAFAQFVVAINGDWRLTHEYLLMSLDMYRLAEKIISSMKQRMDHVRDLGELPLVHVLLARSLVQLAIHLRLDPEVQEQFKIMLCQVLHLSTSLQQILQENFGSIAPAA